MPHFDIARTCREARAFAATEKDLAYRGCMKDEEEARQQLAQRWKRFRPQDRNDCVAQGGTPIPSYVELLTCLEMSEEAGALLKPTSREAPQGAAQGGSEPGEPAPAPSEAGPPAPPQPDGESKPGTGCAIKPGLGSGEKTEPGAEPNEDGTPRAR